MNKNCEQCQWAEKGPLDKTNIGAPRALLCKRFPPTPILMPTQQGLGTIMVFPQVSKDIVCGEFKSVIQSLSKPL